MEPTDSVDPVPEPEPEDPEEPKPTIDPVLPDGEVYVNSIPYFVGFDPQEVYEA